MTCLLNNFYLNYGWDHFWCEPGRNVFPKEYVRGPFSSPKLACPLPYVFLSQTEGELLKIRTGIPDSWGDYLIHQLLGSYDSMPKEDVDIAHKLRTDYRLYLGQGIPNPWLEPYLLHPVVPSCKGLKENLRKYLIQLSDSKNKNRKGNCQCCKKNYLLECPDKANAKDRSCMCKTCHSEDIDCDDSCKCIEILRNWVSEDVHLKERRLKEERKNQGKACRCLSESSGSETDDERTNVSSGKSCHCPKNFKMAFETFSNANSDLSRIEQKSKHECIIGKDFLYKGFTEKKGGFGFFPYTRNIYRENKRLRFKDVEASSKQIQTEIQVSGDTKKTQTDNADSKMQTSNKCFRCTMYQHQQSTCKLNPFEKALCISPGLTKNHAVICPYTCHDHLLDQKLYWANSPEKKQKKKNKEILNEKNSEEYQRHLKMEDNLNAHKVNCSLKTLEAAELANSQKISKTVGYYQPPLRNFDNLKYLTDSRLKNYLRERETLRRFRYTTGQNLHGDGNVNSVIREESSPRQKSGKFKYLFRKPNISSSSYAESPRKPDLMKVDRNVTTRFGEEPRQKELIIKYFKDAVESDESRTYGLVRGRGNNKKRRKLMYSKKGRKIKSRKKGENRTLTQVNKIQTVEPGEPAEKSSRNEREIKSRFKEVTDEPKHAGQETFVEPFKRSLQSEHRGEVPEKISPGRTRRSFDVMKYIVGDLLTDEKTT